MPQLALKSSAGKALRYLRLSAAAKAECRADRRLLPIHDPGAESAVRACLDWLREAQDRTTSSDGGVARHNSLLTGWSPSYPETTGYIVPTVLTAGRRLGDADLMDRGRRMLDWLVSIQFPDGGFQGGYAATGRRVPRPDACRGELADPNPRSGRLLAEPPHTVRETR